MFLLQQRARRPWRTWPVVQLSPRIAWRIKRELDPQAIFLKTGEIEFLPKMACGLLWKSSDASTVFFQFVMRWPKTAASIG